MKFLELEIQHFGIYDQRLLTFDKGGFQLVYGPNEAGKSTLLQLLRQTLYGFHVQNSFASQKRSAKMQVDGLLELVNQHQLEFKRTKSRNNSFSLKNLTENQNLEEHHWQAYLGNTDEKMYNRMFGFSQAELRSGEQGLAQSSLDEALFGGGLGSMVDFQKLTKRLKEEQDKIFLSRGRNQELNQKLNRLKRVKQELRNAIIRPEEYQEWVQKYNQLKLQIDQQKTEQSRLNQQSDKLQRLLNGLQYFLKIRALEERIAESPLNDDFPWQAIDKFEERYETQQDLQASISSLKQEIETELVDLSNIKFDQKLLDFASQIQGLSQRDSMIRGYRKDLPVRLSDRDRLEVDLQKLIQKINPELSYEQFSELKISFELRRRIKALAQKKQSLATKLESQLVEFENSLSDYHSTESKLAALPPIGDLDALERLQNQSSAFQRASDKHQEIKEQISELTIDVQNFELQLIQESEWKQLLLKQFTIPLEASICRFQEEFSKIKSQIQNSQEKLEELEQALAKRMQDLNRLQASHDLPNRKTLETARQARDQSWSEIKSFWIDDENRLSETEKKQKAKLFEQNSIQADQIADRREQAVKILAQEEEIQADIQFKEEQKQKQLSGLKLLEKYKFELEESWQQAWNHCDIKAHSPDVMLQWAATYHDYWQRKQELGKKHKELEYQFEIINNFKKSLDGNLSVIGVHQLDHDHLIQELNQAVDHQRSIKNQQESLRNLLSKEKLKKQRYQTKIDELKTELSQIEQDAKESLSRIPGMKSSDLDIALEIFDALELVEEKQNAVEQLSVRITGMQTGILEYEQDVSSLLSLLGREQSDFLPEDQVRQLDTELEQDNETKHQKAQLKSSIQQNQKRLKEEQLKLEKISSEINLWYEMASIKNSEEFFQSLEIARKQKVDQEELSQQKEKLAIIRENDSEEDFLSELKNTNQRELSDLSAEVEVAAKKLEDGISEANQQLGQLDAKINQADKESKSIQLNAELCQLESEITSLVDQVAPLIFAQEIIKQAVEKFRQQNEGEMIDSINQLFRELTGGRYLRISKESMGEHSIIAVDDQGNEKISSELSTGTREQLYLAIRLAYIQKYSQTAEPLPVVMDDILVNFDDQRQLNTLKVLLDFDPKIQIIFLTCHQSLVEKTRLLRPQTDVILLDESVGIPDTKSKVPVPKQRKKRSNQDSPTLF